MIPRQEKHRARCEVDDRDDASRTNGAPQVIGIRTPIVDVMQHVAHVDGRATSRLEIRRTLLRLDDNNLRQVPAPGHLFQGPAEIRRNLGREDHALAADDRRDLSRHGTAARADFGDAGTLASLDHVSQPARLAGPRQRQQVMRRDWREHDQYGDEDEAEYGDDGSFHTG